MNARKQNSPDAGRLFRTVLVTAAILTQGCTARTEIPTPPPSRLSIPSNATVNINTASKAELQALPHIGPSLAAKIIEHRSRYGPFRKTEHILIVEGFGETRFRDIRDLVAVE